MSLCRLPCTPAEHAHRPAEGGRPGGWLSPSSRPSPRLGPSLLTAAPALAARTYDSQISGLGGYPYGGPYGVAVDSSSDNVWVSANAYGSAFEYNSYPSQTPLGTVTGGFAYGGGYIRGLAVNGVNHRLYVADVVGARVDVFDISGAFGELGYARPPKEGTFLNVATDSSGGASSGDIYAAAITGSGSPANLVLKFDAAGNPLDFSGSASYISGNQITGTPSGPFSSASGRIEEVGLNVAVDESGNIYVVDPGNSVIDEYEPSGVFVRAFTGAGAPGGFSSHLTGVAVDPTNGDLLVVDAGNKVVDEFSSSGEYLEQLTGTGPSESTPFGANVIEGADIGLLAGGIAVNSSGYVYVVDAGVVDIFTPRGVVPNVTYEPITDLVHTSATVHASIDLNGGPEVTSCVFQYGPTPAYGSSVPCSPDTPYTGTTAVSADLSGLTAETTYHYRVVVITANGTRRAPDQTLTPRAVYSLSTGSSSNPEPGSATLNGSFTGDGTDTHYYFEYVDFSNYDPTAPDPYSAGQTTAAPPGADAGSGTGTQNVSAIANFSTPYFIYHYRIVATNSFGTSYGSDQTLLSSAPALPTIDTTPASNVTPSSAMLDAQVNPGFGPTTVRFDYGPTAAYGSRTYPTESIGADNADHPVSVEVSGLTPGTTYHFRAVATNFSGITTGPDQTVSTPDLPAVVATAASDVTPTTADPQRQRPSRLPRHHLPLRIRADRRLRLEHTRERLDRLRQLRSSRQRRDHRARAARRPTTSASSPPTRSAPPTGPTRPSPRRRVAIPSPPPPVTCKHGFVKRHGKCVKKSVTTEASTGGVTGEGAAHAKRRRQPAHWLSGWEC